MLLLATPATAQDAGEAPSATGPISLTGLTAGASDPAFDSEAGAALSNVSEGIIYNATSTPNEPKTAESDVASPTSLITIGETETNMTAEAPEATMQGSEEPSTIAQTEDNASMSVTRTPQPANRIGLRSVSNIGLASIGLLQEDASAPLNSFIWRQSETAKILSLLLSTPSYGSSNTL